MQAMAPTRRRPRPVGAVRRRPDRRRRRQDTSPSTSPRARSSPWSASRARARPSRRCRSCGCCPTRRPRIPPARSTSAARTCSRRRATPCASIRGEKISIIFQEPMTSLNPLHTIEKQVGEIMKLHHGLDDATARAPRARAAAQGRPRQSRAAAARLPASALRRPAPARHDRHGARQRARPADRRRADHRARRHHPGADPRAPEVACSASSAWPCC